MTALRNAALLLTLTLLVGAGETAARVDPAQMRADEIAHCPAVPATWGDGQDRPAPLRQMRFAYAPANAPAEFSATQVSAMIVAALEGWRTCGLTLDWLGEDSARATHVIAWQPQDDGQRIAWTDLRAQRLWLSPRVFALLRQRNPALMNSTLQMTLSHEIGHFLGLVAHSRRCVDVTSYYTGPGDARCDTAVPGGIAGVPGRIEFRSELPTACDIARCRQTNGLGRTD